MRLFVKQRAKILWPAPLYTFLVCCCPTALSGLSLSCAVRYLNSPYNYLTTFKLIYGSSCPPRTRSFTKIQQITEYILIHPENCCCFGLNNLFFLVFLPVIRGQHLFPAEIIPQPFPSLPRQSPVLRPCRGQSYLMTRLSAMTVPLAMVNPP